MAPLPEQTLETLMRHDPEGLAALRSHVPSERVSSHSTPHGDVVVVEGRKLHSGRDPVQEARRFVRTLELGEVAVVVLLGFGSGHVARALAEQTRAQIVVFEPDLDVLAVGLGHGPIPSQLSLVTSPRRLSQALYQMLGAKRRGLIARWVPSVRCDPDAHQAAVAMVNQAVDRAGLRARTARVRGRAWLDHYIHNLPCSVDSPGLPWLRGSMAKLPAIVVAAGPSLDRNIHLLHQLRERALILCVNTAAGALARAGIVPHALVMVESLDVSAQLAHLPFLGEVDAFIELTANPALWRLPFRRKLAVSVDSSACARFSQALDPRFHLQGGFCVANAATSIAHQLGCDRIVLIGSDLAYSGGRVYAGGTLFEAMQAEADPSGKVQLRGMEAKREIESSSAGHSGVRMPDVVATREIPAWGGHGTVPSPRDFVMFRDWYENSVPALKAAGVTPYNATEGGARIHGWEEASLADLIERQVFEPADGGPSVTERFAAATRGTGLDPDVLAAAVRGERSCVNEILRLAAEACDLVGHDPDGDLRASPSVGRRLTTINRRVSDLYHRAPLASEALFVPLEQIRERNELNTLSTYTTMAEPLRELDEDLARLLQDLPTTIRRAS